MGFLFKSHEEMELDSIIGRIEMNMSNNYKDEAQKELQELEKAFAKAVESGRLKGKSKERYEKVLAGFQEKMVGYSHKDQKPYWT